MTPQIKLHLAVYCIDRYEWHGIKLSNKSITNIINLVLNDEELNEMTDEQYTSEYQSVYFELTEYELAECIHSDLVELQ